MTNSFKYVIKMTQNINNKQILNTWYVIAKHTEKLEWIIEIIRDKDFSSSYSEMYGKNRVMEKL